MDGFFASRRCNTAFFTGVLAVFMMLCTLSGCAPAATDVVDAPSSSSEETRIAVISDTHITDDTNTYAHHLESALSDIAARTPDATLCIDGDAVNTATNTQYAKVRDALAKHGFSIASGNLFVALGNHECYDKDFATDWARFQTAWGYTGTYHDEVVGCVHLIALGSDQVPSDWTRASYSAEELAWLEGLLSSDEQQGLFSVVLCHQPLTDTVEGSLSGQSWTGQIDDDAALRTVLSGHDDVLVVSAHSHIDLTATGATFQNADGSGPVFVRDGATAFLRESTGSGGSAQGLSIAVTDTTVTVEGRDLTDGTALWSKLYFRR